MWDERMRITRKPRFLPFKIVGGALRIVCWNRFEQKRFAVVLFGSGPTDSCQKRAKSSLTVRDSKFRSILQARSWILILDKNTKD
jgi:hypothetical protein